MENPCFQDQDQSNHGSTLAGFRTSAAMPRVRRPHHLATFHHSHPHGGAVITHTHGGANTIGHGQLLANSQHGIPATAHLHGGRVVGVTGVPVTTGNHGSTSAGNTPVGTPSGMPANLFPGGPSPQPLYSCQAPMGHDHVYQCPGYRGGPVDHQHSNELHLNHHQVETLNNRCDNSNNQTYLDHIEHAVIEQQRKNHSNCAERTEYHYGGSDYSSTEPIYAQPQLHPQEGVSSPERTPPPLAYTAMRGSLRTSSNHLHHGTPARFLLRTDTGSSGGASSSTTTLPTVSAGLMSSHHRGVTHEFSKVSNLSRSSSSGTPAKLKGTGVLGQWKAKCLEGNGGRRAALLLGLLILLLILVLGGLAAVLYLTLGGGFGAIVGQTPQLIHLTEKGSSIVTGQFRITNQNYWHGLEDPDSESFQRLSHSIEKEIDQLFLKSVWAREFNRSEVISLSDGSLVVRSRLHLNTPDTAAAKKLGSAFLRGLHKRSSQEWLGPYTIDITSIRFAEVLIDSTDPSEVDTNNNDNSPTEASRPSSARSSSSPSPEQKSVPPPRRTTARRHDVGWGEWGPWSSCSPCSPQYDQIRTRKCRLDHGRGILVNNIELCLPEGHHHTGHLEGARGNMETRLCQCEEDSPSVLEEEQEVKFTTEPSPSGDRMLPTNLKDTSDSLEKKLLDDEEKLYNSVICAQCIPGEVCVALVDETFLKCRPEKDSMDPTGCGGLCIMNSEVCQPLGSRAFQCHSASLCLDDEWRCADGLCIPQAKRCDGHLNCYDRSDELMCKCGKDEFHCGGKTSCLPISAKCDGLVDCWDGLDEANCTNVDIAFNRGSSAMGSQIVRTNQMNPGVVKDNAQQTNSNARTGDASQKPTSATGGIRVGTTPSMNRTAIGLSSLSNRERELLS